MTTAVLQYHEVRLTLTEMDVNFREFIGGPEIIDIGETLRVMLGDYFYGEPPIPRGVYHTDQDRTIVFPQGRGQTLFGLELNNAIEVMGELFWSLADFITNRALQVNQVYAHRPNECFYKFFPATRELVIYTPVLAELMRPGLVALDGRAVIVNCGETLPSWLQNSCSPSA